MRLDVMTFNGVNIFDRAGVYMTGPGHAVLVPLGPISEFECVGGDIGVERDSVVLGLGDTA
jgi:hypothetical protein